MARTSTDHSFNSISLMFKTQLVEEMKKNVTIKPSSVIKEASGIPPHVKHSLKLQNLLTIVTDCLQTLRTQVIDIKQVSFIFIIFNFVQC